MIAQFAVSIKGHVLCRALTFIFPPEKRSTGVGLRPTDSLHLTYNKRAESCYSSVMDDKADWSRNKMVLFGPDSTFQRWPMRVSLITIQASSKHVLPKRGFFSQAATH